jgi:hypothetical protein
LITKAFADDGLDLSGIEIIKGEQSTFTWIPVDALGKRCIYMFPNINGKLSAERVRDRFAGRIKSAKHFHTEASQLLCRQSKKECGWLEMRAFASFLIWMLRPTTSPLQNSAPRKIWSRHCGWSMF